MGIVLLIGSIVAAVVLFVIASSRVDSEDINLPDPPSLILSFMLSIGILFAGVHFSLSLGKTFNYSGAFSLRRAADWQASEVSDEFSALGDVVSVYRSGDSSLAVGLVRISKDEAETFRNTVSTAEKQRTVEIKAIQDRRARAAAKKETYDVRKIRGIKWFAEGNGQLQTVVNNRMYTVFGTEDYEAMLDALNLRPFGIFRGMSDGYLVPVHGIIAIFVKTPPYKMVNNGVSYLIGFILGAGCLAGMVAWLIWARCKLPERLRLKEQKRLAEEEKERLAEEEKERLEKEEKEWEEQKKRERLEWEAKWAAMSDQEKAEYNAKKWFEEDAKKHEELTNAIHSVEREFEYIQAKAEKKLVPLDYRYTEMKNETEVALQQFDSSTQKDAFDKAGDFLGNMFSAGEHGVEKAKEQYNRLVDVYRSYDARYKISLEKVTLLNNVYGYERKKAAVYISQLRELFESFNYKQKELFDQVKKSGLQNVKFDGMEVQKLLKSVTKFNTDYKIKAEASWDNAKKFAGNMFDETSKFIDKKTKKGKKELSDEDAIMAGIGLGIGLGRIAVEGVGQYFGNIEKNTEIKAKFIEGESKLREAITITEVNRSKADDFVKRVQEINNYLEDAMQRYTRMFAEVNAMLYPPEDVEKSKLRRKIREELGGDFFTDEEADKVFALYDYGKIMATVVDADF
jgi:hypothetical protein